MVYVEGGTANLGDNNNYPVDVASFFINRYEVSQDEWYVIMGENPSNQHRRNYPVDQVNWFNAQRFTQKLSQLSGLPFRLPFEAEWEYAARGGLKTKNFIYAGSNNAEQVAWFREKYYNTYVSKETGTKKPNELGLYDMSGNVYEWCMDWYDRKVPFTGNIAPVISEKIRIKCCVEVVIIPSRNIVKSPAATELTRNDGILITDYGW